MLNRLGHKVVLLDDGPEAVVTFKAGAPELVLLDDHMVEMDGAEAATRMRVIGKVEDSPRVSIVAVSAAVGLVQRAACLESGMDDFLGKPFRYGDQDQLIRRYAPYSVLQD